MKKLNLLIILVMASLTLAACAKRDSEFAARYKTNKAGAEVVDGHKAQEAAEQAATQGLEADIVAVQKYFTDMNSYGPYIVTARILINNYEMPITMSHTMTNGQHNVVRGSSTIAGHTVVFNAVCGNAECSPYYAAMEVYQNNQMVMQVGLMKHFNAAQVGLDRYQFFKPTEALPLVGNPMSGAPGMVDFLKSASSQTVTNSSGFIF